MQKNKIPLSLSGDRVTIRRKLLAIIGREACGTGTEEKASRYIYQVEKTRDGFWVELHRPAFLNKGIDFTVRIPGIQFNECKSKHWRHIPRHQDIISVLKEFKKIHGHVKYQKISLHLESIYKCLDPKITPNIRIQYLSQNLHTDVIFFSLKWLFIEQDLTYWNFSGREKLYKALHDEGLIS